MVILDSNFLFNLLFILLLFTYVVLCISFPSISSFSSYLFGCDSVSTKLLSNNFVLIETDDDHLDAILEIYFYNFLSPSNNNISLSILYITICFINYEFILYSY